MKRGSLKEIMKDGYFTHCVVCGKRFDGKLRKGKNVCGVTCRVNKSEGYKIYDNMIKVLTNAKGYPLEKAYGKIIELEEKNGNPLRMVELWWEQKGSK